MLEPRIMPASYASFFMFMLVHVLALVVSFLAIYASFRRLCSRQGDISIFLTAYLYCFRLFCAQCMCSSTRVWFSSLIIPDIWYLTTISIYNKQEQSTAVAIPRSPLFSVSLFSLSFVLFGEPRAKMFFVYMLPYYIEVLYYV